MRFFSYLSRFEGLMGEATRFTIVGLANALLTFVVFYTLLKILNKDYLISLFVSWFIGMVFSYCLNFLWVFRQSDKNVVFDRRFAKFMLSGVVSISVNMLILRLMVERTGRDPFWLQVLLIPFIVIFNFTSARLWSLINRP